MSEVMYRHNIEQGVICIPLVDSIVPNYFLHNHHKTSSGLPKNLSMIYRARNAARYAYYIKVSNTNFVACVRHSTAFSRLEEAATLS